MTFVLPDFETPREIAPSAIDAMGVIYAASQFDELRVFDVVDRLVELAMTGQLPIDGAAGATFFEHWRAQSERLTAAERRQFYCRSLGACGSAAEPLSNREFTALWARFLSSVSAFLSQLAGSSVPASQASVVAAARDLATNLSQHGYGMGLFVARDLQQQLAGAVGILSDPEVLGAYGAHDMWQVVDRVATLELGGARSIPRYRTLASTGTIIIRWLSKRSAALGLNAASILDTTALLAYTPTAPPPRLTPSPTDVDLAIACEHWLSAASIPGEEE